MGGKVLDADPEAINIINTERLCRRYHCLPSQLEKEGADLMDMFLHINELDQIEAEREQGEFERR